jgi:hypothetical protein
MKTWFITGASRGFARAAGDQHRRPRLVSARRCDICGWHEVLPQVARKFGWSEEQIDRLARLRTRFIALCPLCAELT